MSDNAGDFKDIITIGQHSNDGVFIYSLANRKFSYSNKIFREIFGVNEEEIKSKPALVLRYLSAEEKTYAESYYSKLLEAGVNANFELCLRQDEKNTRYICCDVFYLRDKQTLIGFIKDNTLQKQHENYVVDYTAKKDTFLEMITHNLSGPLLLSQNFLDWMQQSIKKNNSVEKLDEIIVLLQESTRQCIEIVNDFLKEEHEESPSIYVKKSKFNVVEKVNAVLEKLREMNPHLEFIINYNLENEHINSDSVKFFQIIHNLLSNSIKFTPGGGKIEVIVEEKPDHHCFIVRDNGIGIPEKLKPYVFDRRGKAGRDGLKGEKSNGIGLSIVRKLVKLIDGEIDFESQEEFGTTFFLKLPKN